MFAQTLDSLGSSVSNKGFMNFNTAERAYNLKCRPFTQLPEEAWSTNPAIVYYPSLESLPNFSNHSEYNIRKISEYSDQVKVRAPYYMAINHVNVFRLRVVYNMFPWLTNCDNDYNIRNWGKVFTVDGDDYMGFFRYLQQGDDFYSPMTVYLQLSGDWG